MGIFRRTSRSAPVDFTLGNAEELNREHPRSFFIPSHDERTSLKIGHEAKLLFDAVNPRPGSPTAERMWVKVLEVPDGRYVGELANVPQVITTIKAGSRVEFGPEHVIATPDDWPMLELKVIVSKRSHVEDIRPGVVYCEEPLSLSDSGWTAAIGYETDEEMDDSNNFLAQQVGYLTDRWPELRHPLETSGPGAEWHWDDATGAYVLFAQRT
jgi:hypothetical protein